MNKHTWSVLSLFILAGNTFASALIIKDDKTKTLQVSANFIYTGPGLTEALAAASTQEIKSMWSEGAIDASILLNGIKYKVVFDIDYSTRRFLKSLKSCRDNFVEIRPKLHPADRSFYAGLGSQHAVFYTSDNLGESTTAAHEFGHGLMLEHNPGDQRNIEVPGIMFARGTLVPSQFQWDPRALPGQPGGTINPIHRQVRAVDVEAIPFSKLIFKNGTACLGSGSI